WNARAAPPTESVPHPATTGCGTVPPTDPRRHSHPGCVSRLLLRACLTTRGPDEPEAVEPTRGRIPPLDSAVGCRAVHVEAGRGNASTRTASPGRCNPVLQ